MPRFPVAALVKSDETATHVGGTAAVAHAFLPRQSAGDAIRLSVRPGRRTRGKTHGRTGRRDRVC
jgi:hypothetical protein